MSFSPTFNSGVYTIAEICRILNIPYNQIHRWANDYWDEQFYKLHGYKYSHQADGTKVYSFHSLIEYYVFYHLRCLKFSAKKIVIAHFAMSKALDSPYPFASAQILVDGKNILFSPDGDAIIDADPSLHFNLQELIRPFARKIEFNGGLLAQRYWPLGKNRSVVVDPKVQFGIPIIAGTRITTQSIEQMKSSGDSIKTLTKAFGITTKQVKDSIEYCQISA